MSDLQNYIKKRKKTDIQFAQNFDEGYKEFKIGLMIKELRKSQGFTQDELAVRLGTKKSAVSRIENHANDVKLSTLSNIAHILGKQVRVAFV